MNNRNRDTCLRVPKPTLGILRQPHDSDRPIRIFPEPEQIKDPGGITHTLVSNGLLLISGRNLKFAPDRADEGVRFIPSDPEGKTVKADLFERIREKSLVLMVPQLVCGELYFIEISSRRLGRTLRQSRTAQSFLAL